MSGRSSDMTLALTLSALHRLADPAAAIDDARNWTEYIGVVAEDTNAGLNYTQNRRIKVDFFSGTRSIDETLFGIGANYTTERHVLVGTDARHASLAAECGWEFQQLEDAAERAGWELTQTGGHGPNSDGIIDRLWPF